MRFTVAAPVDDLPTPKGIGLTALILCGIVLSDFVSSLLQLSGGTFAGLSSSEHLPTLGSGFLLLAIELYIVWSYRKGEDWARISLLIVSFLIAADEISTIVEHDGNLVVVVSHPVRFSKLALAIFLLYWLNARPLRAWFRNAPPTAADLISSHLAGKLCTAIGLNANGPHQSWQLAFEHDAVLTLHCPWRIVMDDNLAFASNASSDPSSDPVPGISVDGELPQRLLQNLRVKDVRVTPRTSDLFITFEMGLELQTWSADSQSEQWSFSNPLLTVVADSAGVDPRAIASPISTKDPASDD